MSKAIQQVVTISASPAAIKATGVPSVESVTRDLSKEASSTITTKRAGHIRKERTPTMRQQVEESEEDLSDDEKLLFKVQSDYIKQKGELAIDCNGEKTQNLPVRGRLKKHLEFWINIGAPDFIVNTIREGYKIPFLIDPLQCVQRNNISAMDHKEFVSQAVLDLLSEEKIYEVERKEHLHIINPLSVSVQACGKKRLILDLRIVNKCLVKKKFKFEDHKKALEYFMENGYATKFDLKSGYHHVDIFPDHRKYLGFSWTFSSGKTRYFAFNVLPFGLSTAPYLFTKLLRPLVKVWRARGFQSVVYLDDGVNFEGSWEKASFAAHHMYGDLCAAGFVVNKEKSLWEPTQCLEWLGLVWNAKEGNLMIKQKRVDKALILIDKAIQEPCLSARELSRIIGSILSMSAVLGRLTRIMTRHCQITVAIADHWDTKQPLDIYCIKELKFWQDNANHINQKYCFGHVTYNKVIFSDASDYGCAAFVKGNEELICHKIFSTEESTYSSTHRELLTIQYSLEAFGDILNGSRIKWFTDNQSTSRITEVGSMKFELHVLAYKIFSHCLQHNIELVVQWIPRELNRQADFLSKIGDCDDWQITGELFRVLEERWGPHTIDCFASFENAKTRRFYSRFWNPGSLGMDAFYQSWQGENCLLVPPVNLVAQVLQRMSIQRATGTLVVPAWPSAVFWPLLWYRYSDCIVEYMYVKGSEYTCHGRNANSIIGSTDWEGYMIAVRLSFP